MNIPSYFKHKYYKLKRHFVNLDHPYFYVFVRQDLVIQQQLVQASHSSFHMGNLILNGSLSIIPSCVLLGVKDKEALEDAINLLTKHNIKYYAFYEPDNNEGLTSVTTEPLWDRKLRSQLSHYKLWKPEYILHD